MLLPKGGMEGEDLKARTDAEGDAVFAGLVPGAYTLEYLGPGGARTHEITLKPGDQQADFSW